MRPNRIFRNGHIVAINVSLIVVLLLSSMALNTQKPANFSGSWQFDKAKSDLDKLESGYTGNVILKITQTATTIAFSEIYKQQGSQDWETAIESYNLDGKERTSTHKDIGTNKKSAKWSDDKQSLTITNIDTQSLKGVLQDFTVIDKYTLSADGKTLTIERYRKNPVTGESKAKKIYSKN